MAGLSLKNVCKVYEPEKKLFRKKPMVKPAVEDVSIEIEDKEFVVLVGPSGCGKSTTLRMIAGLEEITSGEIYIDDTLVNDMEPKDRDVSMVFQNYALYPHMTVFDNMAFGLKLRKTPKEEIEKKITETARMLGIEEYLNRKPAALSGGQRQRVALGRAIVRNPKVFLFDEPLSNLDAKLRAEMRSEISALHDKLQTTFIYVTHDQVEAMTMGTRMVVMKDGKIMQIGTPDEVYEHPANKFVAGFLGMPQMNFIDGVFDGDSRIETESGIKVVLPEIKAQKIKEKNIEKGTVVTIGIRPEEFHITESGKPCRIELVENLGSESLLHVSFAGEEDSKKTPIVIKKIGKNTFNKGEIIKVEANANAVSVFDKESGDSLID